jgi:hypothetical protein
MTETINSHILKLSGKAELPSEIEAGSNYHVSCEGAINKVELQDQEDGTWDKIYTFKPVKIDLLDKMGKSLKLKDPRSNSVRIRGALYREFMFLNEQMNYEDFYAVCTQVIIKNAVNIADEALQIIKKNETNT